MLKILNEEHKFYTEHTVGAESEIRCCACDSGIDVKMVYPTICNSNRENNILMLCKEDHEKLYRRIKYRWLYNIIDSIKAVFKRN